MTSEEEEDQEEEAPVKLMLIVLNEDAIQGFHEQVLVSTHASPASSRISTLLSTSQMQYIVHMVSATCVQHAYWTQYMQAQRYTCGRR